MMEGFKRQKDSMATKQLKWKIRKGTNVTWVTHVRGNNATQTTGKVVGVCPAGTSLESLGYESSATISDISKRDRYIVETKTKTGIIKLRTTVKSVLESCCCDN